MNLFLIGIMGVLGIYSRYFIEIIFNKFQNGYPYHTLLANILGCLIAGIIFGLLKQKSNSVLLVPLMIGFCGGLTTFSSYTLQAFAMIDENQFLKAISYLLISPILGLISLLIGYKLILAQEISKI